MEQAWRSYLLAIASVFAKANGLALATVSRRYHGTDSFLADFANGHRTITLKKLDEMVAAADGEGCTWNGRRARVSGVASLDQSMILCTDIRAARNRSVRASS